MTAIADIAIMINSGKIVIFSPLWRFKSSSVGPTIFYASHTVSGAPEIKTLEVLINICVAILNSTSFTFVVNFIVVKMSFLILNVKFKNKLLIRNYSIIIIGRNYTLIYLLKFKNYVLVSIKI